MNSFCTYTLLKHWTEIIQVHVKHHSIMHNAKQIVSELVIIVLIFVMKYTLFADALPSRHMSWTQCGNLREICLCIVFYNWKYVGMLQAILIEMFYVALWKNNEIILFHQMSALGNIFHLRTIHLKNTKRIYTVVFSWQYQSLHSRIGHWETKKRVKTEFFLNSNTCIKMGWYVKKRNVFHI